ncbi:dethiobiotin synthase [Bacillus sp. CLL-7-23]|uniref:ATP-dependent dethiobiotin synthetase BioD n=1 Tax=Bacillus changyiensis TaxID=3004103 RepID=A0ABT4X383_9BACI|nr:dethiobiotin synthase [Bacillus changyiensis]MDA7026741.1 dethiobiotin synthase [Bacillus changyiensis]
MKGIFVTGTDTGVGKTIISCGIASLLKEKNIDVGVFKPFLSGILRNNPQSDTALLKQMSHTCLTYEEITPFEYKEPLAPYVAAKQEGKMVSINEVINHWNKIKQQHDFFIVEGAGGIAVPLGENYLVAHVIKALQLPVLIVARPDLGTINHTFLTVQYAKQLGLQIAGIVINGRSDRPNLDEITNPNIIEQLCDVPIVGITPKLKTLTETTVQQMVKNHIDVSQLIKQMGAGK